jgi:hypothetical protein
MVLFVPLFFSSLSWVAMKTTDTALLGRAGTQYLEASSLSDLWTSSTGVIIQGRVLDMFVGNSIATNPKMAGEWLQVGLCTYIYRGFLVYHPNSLDSFALRALSPFFFCLMRVTLCVQA